MAGFLFTTLNPSHEIQQPKPFNFSKTKFLSFALNRLNRNIKPGSFKLTICSCKIQSQNSRILTLSFCPVLTSLSPERISNNLMRSFPSRRSVQRSTTRQLTRHRCELTHFVKVFFCTCSRSTEKETNWLVSDN